MTNKENPGLSVLYIPHGGGPLPLLNPKGHHELIQFLKKIPEQFETPETIIIISAHWEQSIPTLTASGSPPLIYDYYGFAPKAYEIDYPAPGNPRLAKKLFSILEEQNIHAQLDKRWGFDHGMFVPLKLMYPNAKIPCVQMSLMNGLDPLQHINLGRALRVLKDEKILVLGSGFSFHNMKKFGEPETDPQNIEFDQWLVKTMTDPILSSSDRQNRLLNWQDAPHARYCHPTEEHLMPLHVCYGITEMQARLVFHGPVLGKKSCAFLWQ